MREKILAIMEKNSRIDLKDLAILLGESEAAIALAGRNGAVIATGGGIVKHKVNMDYLRQNGIVFFIDRSLDKLITTDDNRPLSSSAQAVARMYEERIELYRKYADHIVNNNTTIDACAERITEILNR